MWLYFEERSLDGKSLWINMLSPEKGMGCKGFPALTRQSKPCTFALHSTLNVPKGDCYDAPMASGGPVLRSGLCRYGRSAGPKRSYGLEYGCLDYDRHQWGQRPAPSFVWLAYSSIAVYDAVNAIRGESQPFYYKGKAARGASEEAAAIAAAHRVLVNYFGAQQIALDAQFSASLSQLRASPDAKATGLAVGEAAAAALIAARAGDGLEASVSYTPGSGPGLWQPTPPKFAPALAPWLAQMRPFTMTSASQFLPDGPTALTSEEWVDDYNLTRILGEVDSTVRTPVQTEIGLFWTEHPGLQYARAFNYLVGNYNLNAMESARMMAILWTGAADAAIGCWNAKFTYNFWRPVTAIRVGGGNSNLVEDDDWTPLGITPNHPEYPAAHGCVTGAVSSLIRDYFRTRRVRVVVDSLVFSDGVHTHTFDDTRDLFEEVFWARIYAGFHYHHSLEDGGALGRRVG
jgi:hypothetical protein